MLIKSADPKGLYIRQLNDLLLRSDTDATVRKKIDEEIRMIRAGEKGERDAIYEIDFHHGQEIKNWMVIHDLRITSKGNSAQIDHLLISRFLDFWVCESKHFADGVSVNERDEWERIFDGKRMGIPSPAEQNKRHIVVLRSAISEGKITMPKRLGFNLRPRFENVVLVSNNARIDRPAKDSRGSILIIKADQLRSKIDEKIDKNTHISDILKIVSSKTIEDLARQIADLHEPMTPNWAAKFGLSSSPSQSNTKTVRMTCCLCDDLVSNRVVEFCLADAQRFDGKIYCTRCQSKFLGR